MRDRIHHYWPLGILAVILYASFQLLYSSFETTVELWEETIAANLQTITVDELQDKIVTLSVFNRLQNKRLDSLSQGLVQMDVQSDLLGFLGKCALDCEVKIEQLKPGKPEQRDNINILTIDLQLSGEFAAIAQMLYVLEYQTVSYRSHSVALINNPAKPGKLQAEIQLEAIAR